MSRSSVYQKHSKDLWFNLAGHELSSWANPTEFVMVVIFECKAWKIITVACIPPVILLLAGLGGNATLGSINLSDGEFLQRFGALQQHFRVCLEMFSNQLSGWDTCSLRARALLLPSSASQLWRFYFWLHRRQQKKPSESFGVLRRRKFHRTSLLYHEKLL